MRLLFDENTPAQLLSAVKAFARGHDCDHVKEIGWSGTVDTDLFKRAVDSGYDVLVTNDKNQLLVEEEVKALARSGIHRIEYGHGGRGFVGFGLAIGSVCAGLPFALQVLDAAKSQMIIKIRPVAGAANNRIRIIDPADGKIRHWPQAGQAGL